MIESYCNVYISWGLTSVNKCKNLLNLIAKTQVPQSLYKYNGNYIYIINSVKSDVMAVGVK